MRANKRDTWYDQLMDVNGETTQLERLMNVAGEVRHKLGGDVGGRGRVDLRRVVADRARHALVVRAVGRVHKGALPVGRVDVVQRRRPEWVRANGRASETERGRDKGREKAVRMGFT
jgi:hypothetical protein